MRAVFWVSLKRLQGRGCPRHSEVTVSANRFYKWESAK